MSIRHTIPETIALVAFGIVSLVATGNVLGQYLVPRRIGEAPQDTWGNLGSMPDENVPSECWALLFEASSFSDATIPGITQFGDDISAMRKHVQAAGTSDDHILVLRGKRDATKARFDAALDEICSKAQPFDLVLVVLEGYGVQIRGVDYILPCDVTKASLEAAIDGDAAATSQFLAMEDILASLDRSGVARKVVLVNPYSIAAAELAGRSVAEVLRSEPYGAQRIVIPEGLVCITSRSLQQMKRVWRRDLVASNSPANREVTVFMRIVIEALSGYADQPQAGMAKSAMPGDKRIHVSEFLRYIEHRAENRAFPMPKIQRNLVYDYVLLPFVEAPADLVEFRDAVVRQVQRHLYIAGLRLLFVHHDAENAAIVFANCADMDADPVLRSYARRMRYASFVATGDVVRAWNEAETNEEPLQIFAWNDVPVYIDAACEQPREVERTVTETYYVRQRFSRVAKTRTKTETTKQSIPEGSILTITDVTENPGGGYRLQFGACHRLEASLVEGSTTTADPLDREYDFVEIEEKNPAGEPMSGWVDIAAFNLTAIQAANKAKWEIEGKEIEDRLMKRRHSQPKPPPPSLSASSEPEPTTPAAPSGGRRAIGTGRLRGIPYLPF